LWLFLRDDQVMRAKAAPRVFRDGPPAGTELWLSRLTVSARQRLSNLWLKRGAHERVAGRVFAQLVVDLRAFGASQSVVELAERAVVDEEDHAELCAVVAALYDASAAVVQVESEPPRPTFPVCDPQLHRALFAALHSAINETLAVPYLAACVEQSECPAAKVAAREILKDEVKHARIGWAVLADPRFTGEDRATLADFMPALLDVCVGSWLADNDVDFAADLPRGCGFIAHDDIRATITEAVGGLILPGLEHVGISTVAARRWAERL
jgi:hypothetical protein